MKRRLGTWLLSSIPLFLSGGLGGCYAHHTADEELLDITFPDDVYPDAGAPVADAGSADKGCTQTDPIQLLICQFTSGSGGLGGLGGTGTTPPATGGSTANPFGDILNGILGGNTGSNSSGGFQDIIDLLGGLGGSGGTNTPATQTPSLEDILKGFGLTPPAGRDAGAPAQMPTLNAETCAKATDAGTRFMCAIQGFTTPTGRRDGGTGFQFPRRDAGAPSTPDSSVPGVLL